jgi:hypothetical protein
MQMGLFFACVCQVEDYKVENQLITSGARVKRGYIEK